MNFKWLKRWLMLKKLYQVSGSTLLSISPWSKILMAITYSHNLHTFKGHKCAKVLMQHFMQLPLRILPSNSYNYPLHGCTLRYILRPHHSLINCEHAKNKLFSLHRDGQWLYVYMHYKSRTCHCNLIYSSSATVLGKKPNCILHKKTQ